jgi:hypothetical protein
MVKPMAMGCSFTPTDHMLTEPTITTCLQEDNTLQKGLSMLESSKTITSMERAKK